MNNLNINVCVTQIVQITRLADLDNPLEMIYFVEGANGERLPAVTTANLLNSLDMQHAAILLGYRIQGILAQRKLTFCKHHLTPLLCHALYSVQKVSEINRASLLTLPHSSLPVGCGI